MADASLSGLLNERAIIPDGRNNYREIHGFDPPLPISGQQLTMSLTSEDVQRIAQLARLELSGGEQGALLRQLNDFFGIVEQMRSVDTRGVEPLYTPLSTIQQVALRLRDDAVTELGQREANQRSAPAVEAGLFLVPRVIE
jgi:aspartyl-tRNA(Asn)/glutamyl-tRNA(Gln) amidotransferase subunit C